MINVIVFSIAAIIILGGALGVVFNNNPVRAALSLVASFFGVAVMFVLQEAHFLAFVQVIVYGGAIVVLFLFVIMLLGVDRTEDLSFEPLVGQRFAAAMVALGFSSLVFGGLFLSGKSDGTGAVAISGAEGNIKLEEGRDVYLLAADLFGRNVVAFEATALLLTIATIGAVVLVKNRENINFSDTATFANSDYVAIDDDLVEKNEDDVLVSAGVDEDSISNGDDGLEIDSADNDSGEEE